MFQVLTFEHDVHLVSSCIALFDSLGTQLKEYALRLVTVFLIPSIIASSPQPPTRIWIWYRTYLHLGFYISLNQHMANGEYPLISHFSYYYMAIQQDTPQGTPIKLFITNKR